MGVEAARHEQFIECDEERWFSSHIVKTWQQSNNGT